MTKKSTTINSDIKSGSKSDTVPSAIGPVAKASQAQNGIGAPGMIRFTTFFRFITLKERFLLIIGTTCAILCGLLTPAISIVSGEVINTFDPDNTVDGILRRMSYLSIIIAIIGVVVWILAYIYYSFW